MITILYYISFILITFGIVLLGIRIFPKDSVFTIAIGSVIAFNIYNVIFYPVPMFGLIFGIDSVVYTIFTFCLMVMYIDYGKRDLLAVLYTSIFSVFFTGFLYYISNIMQTGYSVDLLHNFLSYINCIIATLCSMFIIVNIFDWFRKKNINLFLSIFLVLILASLLNSIVYYGLTFLYTGKGFSNFFQTIGGAYITRIISSALCVGIYALHKNWEKRKKPKIINTNIDSNTNIQITNNDNEILANIEINNDEIKTDNNNETINNIKINVLTNQDDNLSIQQSNINEESTIIEQTKKTTTKRNKTTTKRNKSDKKPKSIDDKK